MYVALFYSMGRETYETTAKLTLTIGWRQIVRNPVQYHSGVVIRAWFDLLLRSKRHHYR
ncbi:hypothetical protein D3C75_1355600 [compost metagenome]